VLTQYILKLAMASQIRSHKIEAKLGAAQLAGNIDKVARTGA
jgi:hypothetical protein